MVKAAEFAIIAARVSTPEPAWVRVTTQRVPRLRTCELRCSTLAPGLRAIQRAAQTAQHAACIESSLALVVLACSHVERQRWCPRAGVRACHIRVVLDAWDTWGDWLGARSAQGVSELLQAQGGRPCGAPGPCAGWGVVRRDVRDEHTRYAVRYLAAV